MRRLSFGLLICFAMASAANATETITYSYDARGRVTAVVHSGTVNNSQSTTYSHDKADNRTNVATTGAPH